MDFGKVNRKVYKTFSVTDFNNQLVSGLNYTDFTIDLFDPDGNKIINTVTVSELASGHYRAMFTPSVSGDYFLAIYNSDYFPWGKVGTIHVYNEDFNGLEENQKRILGLVHENIFIDNTVFDKNNNLIKARVRIYSNPFSVGTNDDVIGEYEILANSNGPGKFKTWSQIKI